MTYYFCGLDTSLHEHASDCLAPRRQRSTITRVPQPIGVEASYHIYFGYAQYACSLCSCDWTMDNTGPNRRYEWCNEARCACHSELFSTALYEGAAA